MLNKIQSAYFYYDKKTRFLVFGLFVNYAFMFYKVIFGFKTFFFLLVLCLLLLLSFLKDKNQVFLERKIVTLKILPKVFTELVKKEYLVCNNPVLAFFVLQLFFCFCFLIEKDHEEIRALPGLGIFYVFFRMFIVPYLIFRTDFTQQDFKKFGICFLDYFNKTKVLDQKEFITSRIFLLFILFFNLCFLCKQIFQIYGDF